jgi:hypothetical protein
MLNIYKAAMSVKTATVPRAGYLPCSIIVELPVVASVAITVLLHQVSLITTYKAAIFAKTVIALQHGPRLVLITTMPVVPVQPVIMVSVQLENLMTTL